MTTLERPTPVEVSDLGALATPPPARRRLPAARVLTGLALAAVTVAFVYPFVWLLSASLKPVIAPPAGP